MPFAMENSSKVTIVVKVVWVPHVFKASCGHVCHIWQVRGSSMRNMLTLSFGHSINYHPATAGYCKQATSEIKGVAWSIKFDLVQEHSLEIVGSLKPRACQEIRPSWKSRGEWSIGHQVGAPRPRSDFFLTTTYHNLFMDCIGSLVQPGDSNLLDGLQVTHSAQLHCWPRRYLDPRLEPMAGYDGGAKGQSCTSNTNCSAKQV